DLVPDLAGVFVKGDDPRAIADDLVEPPEGDLLIFGRTTADHHDQQVAVDHRVAPDAEEILDDAKLLVRVNMPPRLAVLDAEAVEHSIGTEDIDAIAVDDRRAAGTAVVAI